MNVNESERRRYFNNMYYKTALSSNELELMDFNIYRAEDYHRVTGITRLPASRGQITQIRVVTDRDVHVFIFGWNDDYNESGGTYRVQLYNGSSNVYEFDLSNSIPDWGVFTGGGARARISAHKFLMYPELSIDASSTSSFLPFEDKVLISGISGFPREVYKWEYSTNLGSTWNTLPSRLVSSSDPGKLRISASDLMSESEFLNLVGNNRNIQFRIFNRVKSSDIVVLPLRLSSPHIVNSAFEIENCNGSADASVTFAFDRPLYPEEKLQIFTNNQVSQDDADVVLDATNSYTIRGLAAGLYNFTLRGTYKSYQTYTGDPSHSVQVNIPSRPKLEHSFTKKDVSCYDGEDGRITITAVGGTGEYRAELYESGNGSPLRTIPFTASSQAVFQRLSSGHYRVRVFDSNGCVARASDGSELIQEVELLQPPSPVSATVELLKNPLAYGFSDGKAVIRISGGTQITEGYTVTCTRSGGGNYPTGALVRDGNDYLCTISNLPDGDYVLRVEDANYPSLDNEDKNLPCGCLFTVNFALRQPEKLEVTIEENNPVSCNGESDGRLIAHGSGGIVHAYGMPYTYTWYDASSGQPTEIVQDNDSLLAGIPTGNYQVKITDANNIETLSEIYFLNQPDSLRIIFETVDAGCAGSSGNVKAVVTGGTAPYSYQWNKEGETGAEMTAVTPGDYIVRVTDQRGCTLTATVEITAPGGLKIDTLITHPSCFKGNDGAIELKLTGATPPYKVKWKDNNSAGLSRKDLAAGVYEIIITDVNNCETTCSFTLNDPEEMKVELDDDFTLCKDRSRIITAKCTQEEVTYEWYRDGEKLTFTTAEITVDREGTYRVVTTSKNGCLAADEIVVKMGEDDFAVDFTVPTTIVPGTEIHAVNIGVIAADKIVWTLPAEAVAIKLTDTEAVFSIDKKGAYTISLEGFKGDCSTVLTKTIIVAGEGEVLLPDDKNPLIKQFLVTPNPTGGAFKVLIELNKKEDFTMILYSPAGVLMDKKDVKETQGAVFEYDVRGELYGAFTLHLITKSEKAVIKIVKEAKK
jgi:hypothetical protein